MVRDLQTALIGRPAIETLSLVSRINAVEGPKQAVIGKYSHLFRDLGTMDGGCQALHPVHPKESGTALMV